MRKLLSTIIVKLQCLRRGQRQTMTTQALTCNSNFIWRNTVICADADLAVTKSPYRHSRSHWGDKRANTHYMSVSVITNYELPPTRQSFTSTSPEYAKGVGIGITLEVRLAHDLINRITCVHKVFSHVNVQRSVTGCHCWCSHLHLVF